MSTLVKTTAGKWKAIVRVKGYPQKTKTFPTKQQAKQWAEDFESTLPSIATPQLPSIPAIFEAYLCHIDHNPKEAGYVRRLQPYFENRHVDTLTPLDLDSFKAQRLKTLTGTSIRKDLLFISRVYTFVIKVMRLKVDNPVSAVKLPAENKPRDRVASPKEIHLILDNVSDIMRPLFVLALETAMRRSELVSLRWENIDLGRKKLLLPNTKNGTAREVPLNSVAVETLRKLKGTKSHGRVFNLSIDGVSTAMRRVREGCGLYDLRFHDLRHTAITKYAKRGLSAAQLKVISGHKCMSQLSRYVNLKASDVVGLMG